MNTLQKIEMASMNDTYYTSEYGNYLRSALGQWNFYPIKNNFSKEELMTIIKNLEQLSKNTQNNDLCPNCVTPWKCNGPHIQSNSLDGVQYYSCEEGIFMKECDGWNFIPNERSFTSDQLLNIINTLNILNENKYEDEEN